MDSVFIKMLNNAKTREKFRHVYDRWVLYRWALLIGDTQLVKKTCSPIVAFPFLPKDDIGVQACLKIRDIYVFENDKNIDSVLESIQWLNTNHSKWFKHPIFPTEILHMPMLATSHPLFYATYIDSNIRDLMTQFANLYTNVLSGWFSRIPLEPKLNPMKTRIGFISGSIGDHSVGRVLYGLIERLSEHFEVYVYINPKMFHGDHIVDILRQNVNLFGFLPTLKDNVQMVLSHQIGVMIYPDPLEDMLTYLFGCHRLAPVQISTWGHPGTTGLPFIDYYVTSKVFRDSQEFYSEKLIEFDSLSIYYEHLNRLLRPEMESKDILPYLESRAPGLGRQRFGIPLSCNIYGTLGPPCKFSPEFIKTVQTILDHDPKGVLVLMNEHTSKIHERCIILDRRLQILEFSLYIHSCDVILDSFPFGGLISAYDTFTVGRSLITLPCKRLGHFAPGFYRYMGLEDLIAQDPGDYIQKALRVTHDPSFRHMFETRIRQNVHKIHSDETTVQDWVQLITEVS